MCVVHVDLDGSAYGALFLAGGHHRGNRVAAVLAGDERDCNYLQPTMDKTLIGGFRDWHFVVVELGFGQRLLNIHACQRNLPSEVAASRCEAWD